jgi:dihydrofolate reductase
VSAKLVYSAIASLDGYVADADGNFDWAAPDAEVHAFVNDLERPVGTYLYGRRMYETMVYWADPGLLDDEEPVVRDFARIWQAAGKVVYSTTLESPSTPRTRVERRLDPDAVRRLKAESTRNLTIGGAEVAGQALRAGLVDELQLLAAPVLVGGGTRALPDEVRSELELLEERRFGNGTVFLRYRVAA